MTTRKIYKLTDQNGQTYGGFQFMEGEWAPELDGTKGLCSSTVYHSYSDPLLAVLFNPLHANIADPVLWEGEAKGVLVSDGLKQGDGAQRLLARVALPEISTDQKIAFAILCSLEVCGDQRFMDWANAWLDGSDRSAEAAAEAAEAAEAEMAARAAALEAVWAEMAARAAARAARAAAELEVAALEVALAAAALEVARAAWAAAWAAGKEIGLPSLAKKAMGY